MIHVLSQVMAPRQTWRSLSCLASRPPRTASLAPRYSGAAGSLAASFHAVNCASSTGFISPWNSRE